MSSNKFHIKITNNETGEVVHDSDICSIVGGFTTEEGAVGISLSHCNASEQLGALHAAKEAINNTFNDHPELKLAELLVRIKPKTEAQNDFT